MMFIPSDYLKTAIEDDNRVRIHNELCSMIHKDPSFQTGVFWKAVKFIEDRIPDIIESHDGQPFEPETSWNKEYWALVISTLMDNFSSERIRHAEEVGQKLFGTPTVAEFTASTREYTHEGSNYSSHNTANQSMPRQGRRSSGPSRPAANVSGYHSYRGKVSLKKWVPIAGIAGVAIIGTAAIGIKRATMVAGAVVVIAGAAYLVKKSR